MGAIEMRKNDISKVKRNWLIALVSVLGAIVVTLTVLLILEANGVFYQKSESGDKITPPERADAGTLTEGDYSYVLLTDNTVMITSYMKKDDVDVVVPSSLGGYQVSAIGESAYALSVINSKTITMPEGITYIGKNAFFGAINATLYLPSTIKQIDNDALKGFDSPVAIYFAGTKAQWDGVKVGSGNKALAIITYKEG